MLFLSRFDSSLSRKHAQGHQVQNLLRLLVLSTFLATGLLLSVDAQETEQPPAASPPTELRAVPAGPAVSVLPIHVGDATDSFFYLDLQTGATYQVDRLRRDPLRLRARRLEQNLFETIGRPIEPAAVPGEIFLSPIYGGSQVQAVLFVESSTGYMAFFDDIGRRAQFGTLTTVLGRPFGTIAAGGGNFALFELRDRSGRSVGAYLYAAASGRALYLDDPRKLPTEPSPRAISELPTLAGPVSATAIRNDREPTDAYLLADDATGGVYIFDLSLDTPTRLTTRQSELNLFQIFTSESARPTLRRFLPIALEGSEDTTTHVLWLDAGNGDMAVMETTGAQQMTIRKLRGNLYDQLRDDDDDGAAARQLSAIARKDSNGETLGVWVLDAMSRAMTYLDQPADPAAARLARVLIERE